MDSFLVFVSDEIMQLRVRLYLSECRSISNDKSKQPNHFSEALRSRVFVTRHSLKPSIAKTFGLEQPTSTFWKRDWHFFAAVHLVNVYASSFQTEQEKLPDEWMKMVKIITASYENPAPISITYIFRELSSARACQFLVIGNGKKQPITADKKSKR